jgi:serine/threonine protein kinase/Flp pilus assembly protein TadD
MSSDNPENWHQVKEIFYAALPLAPDKRIEFLDGSCKGDDTLRREVESMLSSSDAAGSFMRLPAVAEVAETLANEAKRLQPNQTISHYRVISSLGRGGMGEVYLAEDTRLGRKVGLKVLSQDVARDKERLDRFEQEANAASALNHPNILTVHEFGLESGIHFLATEFVDGETLREKIDDGSLSLVDALDVAEQTSFALLTAHASGIIHRDIKPENIMIRRDGIVKVLDFGLAKLTANKAVVLDAEAATRALLRTKPGVVMGTASYMSPEQARGKEIDARTDTFSLGVVLYEMLTGHLPFAGETMNDTIAAMLTKEPPPLARYVSGVPDELQRIVRKALAKKPDERYQTARDMMTDVKSLHQEMDVRRVIEGSAGFDRERMFHTESGQEPPFGEKSAYNGTASDQIHSTSSAEYLISGFKQNKRWLAGIILAVLAGAGLAYWYFAGRPVPSTEGGPISSIAVLPFENGSGDANLDYLSDGLSESLIDRLSQFSQLKVVARSSSFKYREQNIDLQDAANKLGVQAIVTGRVVRHGDDLSIRVEMVDTRNDRQLWSEQYDRRSADLVSVQQEIARTASEKLRLKLSGAQEQQFAKRETANPEAYELLLKGDFYWNKGGSENRKNSINYYDQAIAIDPNYALAYAGLSYANSVLSNDGEIDAKEGMARGEAAAVKALELDEGLAEGHHALAYNKELAWDWGRAEQEFQRAVELNSNYAEAHASYAVFQSLMGRHEQAIASARRAKELDPLSIRVDIAAFNTFYFARRYEQALVILRQMHELDPQNPVAQTFFGYVYADMGNFSEAIAAYNEAAKLGDKTTSSQIYLGNAYARAGRRDEARAILNELQRTTQYVSPGELAVLYAGLGERDQAFQCLERAYAAHDIQLQYLKVDPGIDPLRSDPRFQDLVRRVGFPVD